MQEFDLRFIKTVLDDTGHRHPVCQHQLRVRAADEFEAIRTAETEFCRIKTIPRWTAYADVIEVRPVH